MTTGDSPSWPVELEGITEALVTTEMAADQWNVAALGLHAGDPVTARTWGRTRTRRNFDRQGTGVVQFVDDPVAFAEAALAVWEVADPVLEEAAAWVRVSVTSLATGTAGGTGWEDWALSPTEARVRDRTVPRIDRGFNAVVEATVAASRLDVPAYDDAPLRERLAYFEGVVDRCGGTRDREAMDRIRDLVEQ